MKESLYQALSSDPETIENFGNYTKQINRQTKKMSKCYEYTVSKRKKKWLITIFNGVQYLMPPRKYKLKLLWDTSADQSEWLSSRNPTINVVEDMKREEALFTSLLVDMQNNSAIMEISLEISQKNGNRTIIWHSYFTHEHIPSALHTQL